MAPGTRVVEDRAPARPILVVATDQRLLDVIAPALRDAFPCPVIVVVDPATVVQQAGAHNPKVIVLDVGIALGGGYRALQALKTDPATEGIPIIAMPPVRLRSAEAVAPAPSPPERRHKPSDPFDLTAFLAQVRSWIERDWGTN